MKTLTKSRFVQNMQCPKAMWLASYKPELGPIDASTQAKFDEGKRVGELARGLFGPYEEMTVTNDAGYPDIWKMASKTKDAITRGVENICEAAFLDDNKYCAVDILHKKDDGWEIYEVKSSTEVTDTYLCDVAYQKYVLEGCGLKIDGVFLVLINKEYVRQGEVNIHELFKIEDVTDDCDAIAYSIPGLAKQANDVLKLTCEPVREIGEHCCSPYDCAFWEYCKKQRNIPTPSVLDLYRMDSKKKFKFIAEGKLAYADVKDEDLTDKQQRQIRCYETGEEVIDVDGIKAFLDEVKFPLYHLDFETMKSVIPPFDGTKPNQQIPFQYSLHIQQGPCGKLTHKEFLAESGKDPMRAIAESLCENIPNDVCVMAYNKSFECGQLAKLASMFPDLSEHLLDIREHVVDLLRPFQGGCYYTPAMGGSFSIKSVLPALFPDDPELDYHNLEGSVHNGSEAMNIFPQIQFMPKDEQKKARRSLLKYCELDTYAMVKVLNKLYEVSGQLDNLQFDNLQLDNLNEKKKKVEAKTEWTDEEKAIIKDYSQWRIKRIELNKDDFEMIVCEKYDTIYAEIRPDNYLELVQVDDDGYEREDENNNVIPIWYDYLLVETKRCKIKRYALVEVKDIYTEVFVDDDGKIIEYEHKGNLWFKEQAVYCLGDVVKK